MRYLKKYEIFESNTLTNIRSHLELKSTINDILLEVEDEGYKVDTRLGIYSIEVEISSFHNVRDNFYEDVIDTIERVRSYVEDNSNLILNLIDVNMDESGVVKTKIENLRGSRKISNCIDYFHSFAKRISNSDRYKINGVNLCFTERLT